MKGRVSLPVLDAEIEARAEATRRAHPHWPCKSGCDLCCRSLPHLPTISEAEWLRLRDALASLDPRTVAEIRERTLEAPARGPLTCPMLDRDLGSCRVYPARPIACRTYGFYTERDAGLHCDRVTRALDEHGDAEAVVWGNGEAIANVMRPFGEPRTIRFWMAGFE